MGKENIMLMYTIKVYLSSSNQVFNLGEEPFTNERYEMDLITDLIEKELKEHNIKVYRNNYLTSAKDWNKDAEEKQVNLKLAIQTESSSNHDKYGLTTYVNNRTQAGKGHLHSCTQLSGKGDRRGR